MSGEHLKWRSLDLLIHTNRFKGLDGHLTRKSMYFSKPDNGSAALAQRLTAFGSEVTALCGVGIEPINAVVLVLCAAVVLSRVCDRVTGANLRAGRFGSPFEPAFYTRIAHSLRIGWGQRFQSTDYKSVREMY